MVRSMTGFGRAESLQDGRRVSVEIRSVNHRYFEFGARLPSSLASLEARVRERVHGTITRGKISVSVQIEGDTSPHVALRINDELAQRYVEIAREMRTRYGLRGDLELEDFLNLPDILTRETEALEEDAAWKLIAEPLEGALAEFQATRTREGEALARDLGERLRIVGGALERVEARAVAAVDRVRQRLRDRLAQISSDAEYNQQRLEVELTLFADRSDVTEECVRLRSHLDQFAGCAAGPDPAGRRFNFLLQEMNREVNTIGSKSQDLGISQDVISAKEELERIREQVQNVE